jgi:hypothetical protein
MSTLHAFSLILLALIVVINSPGWVDGSHKKTELSVGYLTAIKGNLKDRQGLAISGAITMALGKLKLFFVFLMKCVLDRMCLG